MNSLPIKHIAPLIILIVVSQGMAGEFTKHVNPFIGTGGHGHTFPGATVPFGMVQLSPDTRVEGWDACGGYHYSDTSILGFSHTHLSGTGIADYGDILFFPTEGSLLTKGLSSTFLHSQEKASPGYYSVFLRNSSIQAELTATKRVGVHRYTFSASGLPAIVVNLQHGLGPDAVLESSIRVINDHEITGLRRSSGWAKDQYVYFVAQFSKSIINYSITGNDSVEAKQGYASGTIVKAYLYFSPSKERSVIVKVGISSVSIDGARNNIKSEVPDWNFDKVRKNAEKAWDKELGKIEVEGGTDDQATTFYTALYHVMIAPNIFNDADGRYRGMDGKIHTADGFDKYTVFSLWDTFRAEHPLLTIIDQKRTLDFVRSLLQKQKESGTLPVWELASNETWTMIGYHSVPVIADAYMKGIRGFNDADALAVMMNSAKNDRFGLSLYRTNGFISGEGEGESVSKTLEYAYDDWCIAAMAKTVNDTLHEDEFRLRSQSFRNIFDASTGFFRPKENGCWIDPFDPTAVTVHYTEANPWQYNFFAPHDVGGLIELQGGKERFIEKLDSLFYGSSNMAGRQQSDITGLIGQYAQGNEPSHHVAYLYNYAGAPWKTQAIIRRIMDSLYTPRPDGLCGNDDCGQMSAWYVMSAMGLYQVCPGQPMYCVGSPLFKRMTIHFENDKKFVIHARNNSGDNRYIQSASLNGTTYTTSYLNHDDLMKGGMVELQMGPRPNPSWASREEDCPHSPPSLAFTPVPYFHTAAKTFTDSMTIEIASPLPGAEIWYSTGGEPIMIGESQAGSAIAKYTAPLLVNRSTYVTAYAQKDSRKSIPVSAKFVQSKPVGTLTLQAHYDQQYTGGGDGALVDGLRGGLNFRLGSWQGYHGDDLDVILDLGTEKVLSYVGLGCLQDNTSWIFFPKQVEFYFSNDNRQWNDVVSVVNDISPQDMAVRTNDFGKQVKSVKARYVKVHVKNIGICPSWHKGAGERAWLFVDEILINVVK